MTPEEARERFGSKVNKIVGEETVEIWHYDNPKIRGLIVKWANDVEEISATQEEFSGGACVDDFWEWVSGKMGEGFNAVFQEGWYESSGEFDRVSKGAVVKAIENLYENKEDFADNIDSKWSIANPVIRHDSRKEQISELETNKRQQAANEFYVVEDMDTSTDMVDRIIPDVSAYKYHMKMWALSGETIQAGSDSPNADDFVSEFKGWIDAETSIDSEWVIDDGDGPKYDFFKIPSKDDVAQWCRDMWKNDEGFRRAVKKKWNREVETDEDEEEEEHSNVDSLNDMYKKRDREKRGQRNIGEYGS